MVTERVRTAGPTVLVALGGFLFGTALVYHLWVERLQVAAAGGPLLALLIDALLPLGLAYAGAGLADADYEPSAEWRIVAWTLGGGALFLAAMGATMVVRAVEGRAVAEPVFVALVAAEVGALAGFVAGLNGARARRDARRSRRTRRALGFVNRTLRHDLGNRLTVMRGRAEFIAAEADAADPDRIRSWADDVSASVEESEALIDATGAMAETLMGEREGDVVDVACLAAEVCERATDRYDAEIRCDLPDEAPARGNEALKSVVSNLVENAVEHGPGSRRSTRAHGDAAEDGSATASGPSEGDERAGEAADPDAGQVARPRERRDEISVAVSASVGEDSVTLRVADDGVGVSDDEKESIFEPRTGEPHGGGLHLASTLVERFGGSIDVRDNEPRGAVFVVELPRADA